MPRETKKAREAREAAERDAADRVWHQHGQGWRRRQGQWCLCLEQRNKPLKREMAWIAALVTGRGAYVAVSAHLGDVDGADMDAIRAAADAWIVEETRELWALVHPQETPAQGEG